MSELSAFASAIFSIRSSPSACRIEAARLACPLPFSYLSDSAKTSAALHKREWLGTKSNIWRRITFELQQTRQKYDFCPSATLAQDSPARESIRFQQHRLVQKMAEMIESTWAKHLDLTDYWLPEDLGFVEGRLEGEKLVIENKCYQSRVFRKMHLELARVGNTLDILHCVMFPRPQYAIPMFGVDLVGGRGQLSACIVDLSPVSPDLSLPAGYCADLDARLTASFSQPRDLPPWGSLIFSKYCTFIRPADEAEEDAFLEHVRSFLEVHCMQAQQAAPLDDAGATQVLDGQKRYCSQQQQNDKTRRVLEKAFGEDWAERYMTTVLFDLPDSI